MAFTITQDPNTGGWVTTDTVTGKKYYGFDPLGSANDAIRSNPNLLPSERAALTQEARSTEQDLRDKAESEKAQTNSAKGKTAEQEVKNDTTPTSSGAGETSTATNETNLSDKELKKLNSTDKDINQTATEDDTTSVNDKDERGHVDVESSGAAGREAEAADEEPLQPIGSNALHSYTSYTYRITLFLLTDQDYTNLADSPSTFEPRWSLISSG